MLKFDVPPNSESDSYRQFVSWSYVQNGARGDPPNSSMQIWFYLCDKLLHEDLSVKWIFSFSYIQIYFYYTKVVPYLKE